AFSPEGPAWVSSNGGGLSQVYDASGGTLLTVTIPPAPGAESPSAPSGQVVNGTAAAFMGDAFIFVTEGGTIAGWQPADGPTAVLRADSSARGAIYKGVTIAQA